MAGDHYFTGTPESALRQRTISIELAGQTVDVTTAGGVFSPDRMDQGTHVLLANAPAPPPSGNFLDLGCGWGPISFHLATASPLATIWAVDVNERALDLVRLNAQKLGLTNIRAVLPDDVPADLTFRTMWSNPPIRVGKNELHGMLEKWLPRLDDNADAWLVVQRNLGSDSLHRWLQATLHDDFSVLRAATGKGYRVLHARRRTRR